MYYKNLFTKHQQRWEDIYYYRKMVSVKKRSNLLNSKPIVFMCSPKYLGIRSDNYANEKEQQYHTEFENEPTIFRTKALQQWDELQSTYKSWGADILSIHPLKNSYDQTYTADPAFTLFDPKANKLIIAKSHFANSYRNSEVNAFANSILELSKPGKILADIDVEVHQLQNFCEGTGDNYYDAFRDLIFSGFTLSSSSGDLKKGRSNPNAHAELEAITGVEVVSLEVKHPCFHIDTCLAPLPSGHMLVYKNGMTEQSYKKLLQKAFIDRDLDPEEFIIPVSQNDAENNLVTNFLCIDNKIAIPQFGDNIYEPINPDLINRLQNIGYEVTPHNMGQFIKVGGAVHCISHLVMKRVKGGLINNFNFKSKKAL